MSLVHTPIMRRLGAIFLNKRSFSKRSRVVSSFGDNDEAPPPPPLSTPQPPPPSPRSSSSQDSSSPSRQFASLSVLEQVSMFSKLAPEKALVVANEARLQGGGAALAAACLSQRDRATSFLSVLDSSKMRSLLILLADVAFLRGGSQAALLSQHALPLAIARSSDILIASPSSNDVLDLPLLAAASRALSTHACVCPPFSRLVERELTKSIRKESSTSPTTIIDSLSLEEWSWMFESFAEGCGSAATDVAHVLSTRPSLTSIDRLTADLVPIERILSGALRAGVDANVAFNLMEAFTNNREKFQLRDSVKAESELLRTASSICVDSQRVSSKMLNSIVQSINKRLELLTRNSACFSAVQSLARQSTDDKSLPLSQEREKLCRLFFGWKLGALFARGNALKSINSLIAAARCLHVLHERSSTKDKDTLLPLHVSGLNRLSKLANDLNIHEVVDGINSSSTSPSSSSSIPGTSTLGDFELQFQIAVKSILASTSSSSSSSKPQQLQYGHLGPVSFSHKIQSGSSYTEAMFEVDVAFPKWKTAIEFDGPSHFLSVPTDTACDALKIPKDYSPSVENPPEVFTRRQLREDSAFLMRLLAQNKDRPESLCRPSPHHRMRSHQLKLLGWNVVNVPWARSVDINKAVHAAFNNLTNVTR